MRIVIDLQACQSGSRKRGIGRYSLALARAMVQAGSGHEFWLALNGRFPDAVPEIYREFDGLIPRERIKVFNIPGPLAEMDPANRWRMRVAEAMREQNLAQLNPDLVHVCSLFEGLGDDVVSPIGQIRMPTAITLYDLIPLVHSRHYLHDEQTKNWYYHKLQALKRADLLLAISAYSRFEAINRLSLMEDKVVNISAGIDEHFRKVAITSDEELCLRARLGLHHPFIMYTGGTDWRKNVDGMIAAFALLPQQLRAGYQLAIVCEVSEDYRKGLIFIANRYGLENDDLVITGFVSETDLILLYNLCHLFVFPSLHEGFGLPVVEAMACGAPVIGSNTSSIPEVIGREDALFDPSKPTAIAEIMMVALTDGDFYQSLRRHGAVQAGKFTWENSAGCAIAAFEDLHARLPVVPSHPVRLRQTQPRLAFVSPLPPEKTGIAMYSAELLPELARYYDIELIVDQESVDDPWLSANFPKHDIVWFENNASRFDRILYQFGNSPFHKHMFSLLKRLPGIVVLHDFYCSSVVNWMDGAGYAPGVFLDELYHSHGYPALAKEASEGLDAVLWAYPMNKSVLDDAVGVIVHSRYAVEAANRWYGRAASADWHIIPHLRAPQRSQDRREIRQKLDISEDEYLICSFGLLGYHKQNHRLVDAFLGSCLARAPRCRLVFVGQNDNGDYGRSILRRIEAGEARDRIRITGYVSAELYQDFLAAADCAVQLRTQSRGETSGSVLDILAHGVPLIVNAHGPMAELPDHCLVKLPEAFDDAALIAALEALRNDQEMRRSMGEAGREWIRCHHHPAPIGKMYWHAIEACAARAPIPRDLRSLVGTASAGGAANLSPAEIDEIAACIAANRPRRRRLQLFVDISIVVEVDLKTGIQRVVRSIMGLLLLKDGLEHRIEPVYACDGRYFYARRFTANVIGCSQSMLKDEPISVGPGDIFLGIDHAAPIIPKMEAEFRRFRALGVYIGFVIYDMLPLRRPNWFPPDQFELLLRWTRSVATFSDKLICISRATAEDLRQWIAENPVGRTAPVEIGWFHLGADIAASDPTTGMPDGSADVMAAFARHPTFVAVGTVEPRKGYAQLLAAFDLLWGQGIEINLVIVGKQGWMVDGLADRLRSHPQLGTRLFWLAGISDEYLDKVYAAATALVAASEGEGFGLPLIEAARFGVPIIARDLPVFREVAGDDAYYFSGTAPDDLATAITSWMQLKATYRAPLGSRIRWLTWQESAEQLLEALPLPKPAENHQGGRQSLAAGLRFTIAGHVNGSYSLAAVNRRLALALDQARPGTVRIEQVEGQPVRDLGGVPAAQRPAVAALAARPAHDSAPEIVISQHWPVWVPPQAGDLSLAYVYWEESLVPAEMVRVLNDNFGGVLAPSTFVARVLINSGLRLPVRVIGFSPDLDDFAGVAERRAATFPRKDISQHKPFTFLHVSSCFPRKGVDVLLQAYVRAFRRGDPVRLMIKGFPNPHNDVPEQIERLRGADRSAPVIELINRDLSREEMLELYAGADAAVLPTRGEGFNIPAAEALAAGVPLIVTGYGAHRDFIGIDCAREVDFGFARSRSHVQSSGSVWTQPDVDDLALALREMADAVEDGTRGALLVEQIARGRQAARALADTASWASRVREAALDLVTRAESRVPTIAWVSTWNVRCGIANYSRLLLEHYPEAAQNVTVLCDERTAPTDLGVPGGPAARIAWKVDDSSSMDTLAHNIDESGANVIVIQHQRGLIAWPDLAKLLLDRRVAKHMVLVTLHNVQGLGEIVEREIVVNALAGVSRVIVHAVRDLDRLKSYGLVDNVVLFPHGAPGRSLARRPARPLPRTEAPLIGTYGFFLPPKGFANLIEALALVRRQWPGAKLRLVTAEYPAEVSTAEIARCRALAQSLNIAGAVEFVTEYLPDAESIELLHQCDLLVMPYQETPEAASGALRIAMASGTPVAVTPIAIFDDAEDAVLRLRGTSPEAIADGIAAALQSPAERQTVSDCADAWLAAHGWAHLGQRLAGMISGLLANADVSRR